MSPDRQFALRCIVRQHNRAWSRKFPGLGPCYPTAAALVELGLADIAIHGFYRHRFGRQWWHHWVGYDADGMVDISGPWITNLNARPEYKGFALGMTQNRWEPLHVNWWVERLSSAS